MKYTSWKTTLSGIASFLAGLGMLGKLLNDFLLNEPINFEQLTIAVTAIAGGLAGVFARDNDKSSEEVGARK